MWLMSISLTLVCRTGGDEEEQRNSILSGFQYYMIHDGKDFTLNSQPLYFFLEKNQSHPLSKMAAQLKGYSLHMVLLQ